MRSTFTSNKDKLDNTEVFFFFFVTIWVLVLKIKSTNIHSSSKYLVLYFFEIYQPFYLKKNMKMIVKNKLNNFKKPNDYQTIHVFTYVKIIIISLLLLFCPLTKIIIQ